MKIQTVIGEMILLVVTESQMNEDLEDQGQPHQQVEETETVDLQMAIQVVRVEVEAATSLQTDYLQIKSPWIQTILYQLQGLTMERADQNLREATQRTKIAQELEEVLMVPVEGHLLKCTRPPLELVRVVL